MFYDELHFECRSCGADFKVEPANLLCWVCGAKVELEFDGADPENDLELTDVDSEEDYDEIHNRNS